MKVKRFTKTAKLPTRATFGSAGYDLYADEKITVYKNNGQATVKTGIAIELPEGYCGQIWPRSGMSARGITRDAGLIDPDYVGEIKVVIVNRTNDDYEINQGDRIAQLVLVKPGFFNVIEVDELADTDRGEGGFGSSGI